MKRAHDQTDEDASLWYQLWKLNEKPETFDNILRKIQDITRGNHKADVNAINTFSGDTPLLYAVKQIEDEAKQLQVVKLLLSRNADINKVNDKGETFESLKKSFREKMLNSYVNFKLIDGDKRLEPCEYETGGIKNSLHGIIHQLNMLMIFLYRGMELGYDFHLATEMKAAGKFDDLVFKYKWKGKDHYRFIQLKHRQNSNGIINENDLKSTCRPILKTI